MDLNPYHTVPTLVDRDLVLYDSRVIIEYLDERFPHPPLMPVDPVTRAQFRLALFRIETDWYELADQFEPEGERRLASKSRKMLRESILASVELFAAERFFLSEDFSLVDCSIAPILWRLPIYGIELGFAGRSDRKLHEARLRSTVVPGQPDRTRAGNAPVSSASVRCVRRTDSRQVCYSRQHNGVTAATSPRHRPRDSVHDRRLLQFEPIKTPLSRSCHARMDGR